MYIVDLYRRVRRAHFVEGMIIREAARVFGLHRSTVNKMLEYSAPPGYRREQPPRRPKLDPYTRPVQGSDRPYPGGRSIAAEEAASHSQTYL